MSILLLLWGFLGVSWSHAEILGCPSTGFQSCEEVQAFREASVNSWEPDLQAAPRNRREASSIAARLLAMNAGAKRERDVARILSGLDGKGVEAFAKADFTSAVRGFRSQISSAVSLLRSVYSREIAQDEFPSLFPGWIKERVLGLFEAAVTGDFRGVQSQILEEGDPLFRQIGPFAVGMEEFLFSSRFQNDVERARHLRKVAASIDRSQSFDAFLTPYHARMLLLFQLASRLTPVERDSLASELELKSNLSDLLPQGREPRKSFGAYIFHDGYFYGATGGWTDSILQAALQDPPSENSSTDCSIFVQKVLEAVGYESSLSGERMTTNALMEGEFSNLLTMNPLCSERQLDPGDLIVRSGHVYLFTGYGKNPENGQWELRIAEATGMFSRTVRLAALPVYQNDCRASFYTTDTYKRLRLRSP